MLVAAGPAGARDHALISLLALNGLRVSEAIGARIEDLAATRASPPHGGSQGRQDRVHAARTAHRSSGRSRGGQTLQRNRPLRQLRPIARRHGAARIVRRSPKQQESPSRSAHTPCATGSSQQRSTPECRCETFRKQPHTPTAEPPCATTEPESPSTDTPPTSSPPSSPAQPAD